MTTSGMTFINENCNHNDSCDQDIGWWAMLLIVKVVFGHFSNYAVCYDFTTFKASLSYCVDFNM